MQTSRDLRGGMSWGAGFPMLTESYDSITLTPTARHTICLHNSISFSNPRMNCLSKCVGRSALQCITPRARLDSVQDPTLPAWQARSSPACQDSSKMVPRLQVLHQPFSFLNTTIHWHSQLHNSRNPEELSKSFGEPMQITPTMILTAWQHTLNNSYKDFIHTVNINTTTTTN